MYGQSGPEPWRQLVQPADRGPSSAARFIWLTAAVLLVAGVVGGFVVVTNPNLVPNLLRFNAPGPAGAPLAVASSPPASASRAPSTPSPSATPPRRRPLRLHRHPFPNHWHGSPASPPIPRSRTTTDDLSDFELPETATAFSQLKLDQAEYLGSETSGRRTLHHLVVPSLPSAGVDTAAMARAGCRLEDMAMHFWIRDNGIPVTATFDFSCSKRTLFGTSELVMSATYEFTKFGKPITIDAPRKFRRP